MVRPTLKPGKLHPITIERTGTRVTAQVGDLVVADTADALTLRESKYPAVQYIPIKDVDPALLVRTETTSYCPYKGDASYYTVVVPDGDLVDAVWTYETPHDAVAQIAGHMAFYPNKVTITVG